MKKNLKYYHLCWSVYNICSVTKFNKKFTTDVFNKVVWLCSGVTFRNVFVLDNILILP